MTRFDEITRLKELEKKAKYDRVEHGAPFRACAARAAPWLLEAAACFQPGDAEILHLMCNYLAAHKPDGHLIENGPSTARGVDCMTRLQKAAAIMEELE